MRTTEDILVERAKEAVRNADRSVWNAMYIVAEYRSLWITLKCEAANTLPEWEDIEKEARR